MPRRTKEQIESENKNVLQLPLLEMKEFVMDIIMLLLLDLSSDI